MSKARRLAKAKKKLDRLYSQLILERDERVCQWCGASAADGAHIDTSHILPREYLATRWHPDNAVALCFGCHKRRGKSWHSSPLEAVMWLQAKLGVSKCEELLQLSQQPFDFNLETAARLEAELKERLASITPKPAALSWLRPLKKAGKLVIRQLRARRA
jgi:hypothetical protein